MSLAKITQVKAPALAVPGDDIDTDRIIPARFLRCVTFEGLGEHAFRDERTGPDGKDRPHPLNSEQAARIAKDKKGVMVVGFNFGCGSSREHAPQSLWRFGFTALVGGSFAEIFFGNSTALGVPCVTLSKEDLAELNLFVQKNPGTEVAIDLEKMTVRAGDKTWKASIPASARESLISGKWDPIADLLEGSSAIEKTAQSLAYVAQ
ncbi:3-isopropylmalate dehydratase small subunit [bacterium]|nr:3-isopropylmalate dehydratase small subunit [bacterium]